MIDGGVLDNAPFKGRSSVGIDTTGMLHVDRIAFNAYWKGSGQRRPLRLPSGPKLSPRAMVSMVRKATEGWTYSAVSIGYPGPVLQGKLVSVIRSIE